MQEDVFFEVSDEFINLANDLSEDWAGPMLSAAFMHAAARYNVFQLLEKAETPEEKGRAIEYLTDQFRKMLVENLQDLKSGSMGG